MKYFIYSLKVDMIKKQKWLSWKFRKIFKEPSFYCGMLPDHKIWSFLRGTLGKLEKFVLKLKNANILVNYFRKAILMLQNWKYQIWQ